MWGEAPETGGGRSPILTVAALGVWCLVWEAVGRSGALSIVPPLSRVASSGLGVVTSAKFASAAWISSSAGEVMASRVRRWGQPSHSRSGSSPSSRSRLRRSISSSSPSSVRSSERT